MPLFPSRGATKPLGSISWETLNYISCEVVQHTFWSNRPAKSQPGYLTGLWTRCVGVDSTVSFPESLYVSAVTAVIWVSPSLPLRDWDSLLFLFGDRREGTSASICSISYRACANYVSREFKATAGAETAAGSKFPPKLDTVHVRRLHEIWLRESVCFALETATSGLFRFSGLFQRTSRHFKNSMGYCILESQFKSQIVSMLPLISL